MNKKYELVLDDTIKLFGRKLFRIRAKISFGVVKEGGLGGYIESEKNLSHFGNAWVSGNAFVYGDARVYGNAEVSGDAEVYGNARVYGNAFVSDNARVYGDARVYGNAEVSGDAFVSGDAEVSGDARVTGHAFVSDNAEVSGDAFVSGNAFVSDNARVYGDAEVYGNAEVSGDARVKSSKDYIVFKNTWSSFRWFCYTKSNKMWRVGCFYGTGQELIKKAYADSEDSGKHYEAYVKLVADLEKIESEG